MIGRALPCAWAARGGAGRLCPRGSPPKLGPGSPLRGAGLQAPPVRLESESPEELNLGESLGVLQQGGRGSAKRAFLFVGAGLTIQGDGNGGAVMQQAASGVLGQELGGVGGK